MQSMQLNSASHPCPAPSSALPGNLPLLSSTFNATTDSGAVEIGIVSRGLVGITSNTGAVDVTVPNSFNGEYRLSCNGCGLSISGAEGTTVAEAERKRGLLTGLIGDHSGAFLEIVSGPGDVAVRVIAG